MLVALIHEFKHCTVYGMAAWTSFRAVKGKDLQNLIERDFAYVKTEIEDHLYKLNKSETTLVNKVYTVFSGDLSSCLEYAAAMLKKYFIDESRVLQEARRVALITLLYIGRAYEVTADLEKWLR